MSFLEPVFEDVSLKPEYTPEAEFNSIAFLPTLTSDQYELQDPKSEHAFLLMDENENLLVPSSKVFCQKLRVGENDKVKVISIFGNTGDGKSHTMNNVFFGGKNIFQTSPEQNSCTIGVYAAMQPKLGVLCLDTEGFLGISDKSNRRMRMLLKVLAISDIVIYRTRAERLGKDMYEFLGTASRAFCTHFAQALQSLASPGTATTLGPAVIIFHETLHTKLLENTVNDSAEDRLRKDFALLNYDTNAFSSLRYIGIQTTKNSSCTDFSKIISTIYAEIENTAVRSPRQPAIVFQHLKALNLKFSGEIENSVNQFPEQYFTCTVCCESCNRRCQRSMGHGLDGENHFNKSPCNYQHQFENKVYLCKTCYNNGKEIVVNIKSQSQNESPWYGLALYAWKGSVIDCPHCGEIYRARKYWYGNKSPEVTAVRPEVVHVWKGGNITAKGPANSAQIVLDSVTYLSGAISNYSAQPTKALTGWFADKLAPTYWRQNCDIIRCKACTKNFEKTGLPKHHCRGCGEGFCNACSQHTIPVPARGWKDPVRVCNDCYQELQKKPDSVPDLNTYTDSTHNHNCIGSQPPGDETDIIVRKYGESIYNTISSVAAAAIEYPKEMIKDSARPAYWVPDADSPNCHICRMPFGTVEELELAKAKGLKVGNAASSSTKASSPSSSSTTINAKNNGAIIDFSRHHCRRCGQACCGACSTSRHPVPERGWQTDVRVCDSCAFMETPSGPTTSKSVMSTPTVSTAQPTSVKLTTPDNMPRAKKVD